MLIYSVNSHLSQVWFNHRFKQVAIYTIKTRDGRHLSHPPTNETRVKSEQTPTEVPFMIHRNQVRNIWTANLCCKCVTLI